MDTIADEIVERKEFSNKRADGIIHDEYWAVRLVLTTDSRLKLYINFGGEEEITYFPFERKGDALDEYRKIKQKYGLTEE
jgi:hypothetical protein